MLHTPGFNGAGIFTKGQSPSNYVNVWARPITYNSHSDSIYYCRKITSSFVIGVPSHELDLYHIKE